MKTLLFKQDFRSRSIFKIPVCKSRSAFFGDCRIANLAVRGKKKVVRVAAVERKLYFYAGSYELISLLWIWIRISLNPDLFWLDPDP
jgi:hypothetical protein